MKRACVFACHASGARCGSVRGDVYAVGGSDGLNISKALYAYFPSTNSWRTAKPMAIERDFLGAAVVDDVLYAIGGYDPALRAFAKRVEAY